MVYESFIQHGAYSDRKHTGVYAEKRMYHYYGDQPRLQLVIWRYSLQGPGARGMSLLETSSLFWYHLPFIMVIVILKGYFASDVLLAKINNCD